MIKHIWSVLCKESVINQEDNVISLISILENLSSSIVPVNPKLPRPEKINIPFNFEVVNYWLKDSVEEVKMQIRTAMFDPNGKELSSIVNDFTFPKGVRKLRSRLKIQGISVTSSGEYSIRVSIKTDKERDFKLVADLPLTVNIKIEELKKDSKN